MSYFDFHLREGSMMKMMKMMKMKMMMMVMKMMKMKMMMMMMKMNAIFVFTKRARDLFVYNVHAFCLSIMRMRFYLTKSHSRIF